MGEHAGNRGCHDLVGLGRHRDRRRHADEDQQRGEQEAAADAEQAGRDADPGTQAQQQEDIERTSRRSADKSAALETSRGWLSPRSRSFPPHDGSVTETLIYLRRLPIGRIRDQSQNQSTATRAPQRNRSYSKSQ